GCPLRVRLLDRLEVRPCAGFGWGIMGASGVPSTANGKGNDESVVWADLFAALRVRLHVWGPFHAVAEAELAAPLTPYDFAFDPSAPVYSVPAVAGAGFAGIGAQFP